MAVATAVCLGKITVTLVTIITRALPLTGRRATHLALAVGFTAVGATIAILGRDRRASFLGTFYVLIGSSFADALLRAAAVRSSVWDPLTLLSAVQLSAFQPYLFWQFVQEFPRPLGPYGVQGFARAATRCALVVGALLVTTNLALLVPGLSPALVEQLARYDRHRLGSLYWPVLVSFALPVLPYIVWKARVASVSERRRTHVLLTGIGVGIAPIVLVVLGEMISPEFRAHNLTPHGSRFVGLLVFPALLSIPLSTAYAIVVQQALDVRLIVRKAIQYALARSSLLVVTGTPFVLLVALIYGSRHQSLAEVATGRQGTALLALMAGGILAVAARPKVLHGLDRRFFREQYDAHAILASLVERTHRVAHLTELATSVPPEIERALHVEAVSLLLLNHSSGTLATPTHTLRPLLLESAVARRLLAERSSVEVDWSARNSWVDRLPEQERHWLLDANARLLVPIVRRGGTLGGALVLGEKRSGLPFSRDDRALLRSVAQAIALVLESEPTPTGATSPPVAEGDRAATECPACGRLDAAGVPRCTRCGAILESSLLPPLLAGKFEPIERVGRGGMGVVYRAIDRSLTRDVALKTLPRAAPEGAARMRREARAMAAVSHANLEAIYSLESWRGTPILIVEFLAGGTLADRLATSALGVSAALDVGIAMSGALARLHRAGILHRDIKPSNIGFDGEGTAKLLDFGLAWMLEAASLHPAPVVMLGASSTDGDVTSLALTGAGNIVGTIPYLSPESLDGAPLSPAIDLWALSMVTYEAIAGQHPYAGADANALMYRLACKEVPDVRSIDERVSEPVASFLRECLQRDASRRPTSAEEWRRRAQILRDLA